MSNYSDQLKAFKQAQSTKGKPTENFVPNNNAPITFSGNVESLNEAVYGAYDPNITANSGGYNANDEMKKLQLIEQSNGKMSPELVERIKKSKLPASILESITSNPMIDTSSASVVDNFAELLEKKGKFGIDAVKRINDRLNEVEHPGSTKKEINNQQINETNRPVNQKQTNSGNYLLEQISELIDNKLNALVESIGRGGNTPNMKAIQMKDENRFLFLDTDDNVYECKMIYKGKNKRRKQ